MPDMRFEDLEKDLDMCVQHMKDTDNTETRLGRLFVRFVLGHIYGEYQKYIREAMVQRSKKSGDVRLAQYVELSTRRLGMGARTLRRDVYEVFGGGHDKTPSYIPQTAWNTYDSLVKLRNRAMHGEDVREGLGDVVQMHTEARNVVYAIRLALLGDREYEGISRDRPKYTLK